MNDHCVRLVGLCLSFACLATSAIADEENEDISAIRAAVASYVAAYNRGDAAAVADHWAEDAEYVLPDGERASGREAIRRVFEDMFADDDHARIEVPNPSVRLLAETVAVEEGVARTVRPGEPPEETSYLAIHVKKDGAWRLSAVREIDVPASPVSDAYEHLKQLEWLVGEWKDQDSDLDVGTKIQWSGNHAFLSYSFSIPTEELDRFEGTQVIGWDPVAKVIRSWLFDSDGGFGEGVWSRTSQGEWWVNFRHTLPDGRQGRSTNFYSLVAPDTVRWRSFGRSVDGESLPDVEDITIVRHAPASAPGIGVE